MKKLLFTSIAILFFATIKTSAAPGDTTWVQANITNLDNYGNYDSLVVFPNGSVTYRRILEIFTLGEHSCPVGSTYCHQWDYTVTNYVMVHPGDTIQAAEISRFITPFATGGTPRFPSTWKQQYIFDVTDFASLLKDTAKIRILYSGYSGGFTANVKFAFIEGIPPRNVIAMEQLWNGYFSYGDTADPIANHVTPYTLTSAPNTVSSELRYTVTGHGSDATTQCCEFNDAGDYGHNYQVSVNGSQVATKDIWRNDCGYNELYAQGGTWIYDRGNWCPGDAVKINQHVLGGNLGTYTLGVTFDPYTTTGSYGGYDVNGEVIYYGGYNHTLDASLEDIVAPNNFQDYFRENPSGSHPMVHLRNEGSTTITTINLQYNVLDSVPATYTWNGTLLPLQDTVITLPVLNSLTTMSLNGSSGVFQFQAKILTVNGVVDQDQTDDSKQVSFVVAPTWPPAFIIDFVTNNEGASGALGVSPSETSWQITDMNNNVVASRTNANVSTTYKDTISLTSTGFYNLTITDVGCDGLQWWVYTQNPSIGVTAGSFTVKKLYSPASIPMNGYYYSGTFNNDFGCGFTQYFTVNSIYLGVKDYTGHNLSLDLLPNPTDGHEIFNMNFSQNSSGNLELFDALGKKVYSYQFSGITSQNKEVDLSYLQKGIYFVKLSSGDDDIVTKKLMIQ